MTLPTGLDRSLDFPPIRLSLCVLLLAQGLLIACAPAANTVRPRPAPVALPVNTGDLPTASDADAERYLIDVRAMEPSIVVDARYAGSHNFTGAPLPGYEANRVLLRREAATALARAQQRLLAQGLSLLVFDGYRPVRATRAMVEWCQRSAREDLLRDGYIASTSRHNLGVAIDCTLIDRRTNVELEMGTAYDTFSPAAHTANATGTAADNRARLRTAMEAEGFANYDHEWWHFAYPVQNPVRFDRVIR